MKFSKGFVGLGLIMLSGCASHPEIVPQIDTKSLTHVKFEKLQPRKIALAVENTRAINKAAGNASDVEKRVYERVAEVLSDAGIQVVSASAPAATGLDSTTKKSHRHSSVQASKPNQLTITIRDCKDAPEGSECVNMVGEMQIPHWHLKAEMSGYHGYTHGGSSGMAFGDVSEAYQICLNGLLKQLDQEVGESGKPDASTTQGEE